MKTILFIAMKHKIKVYSKLNKAPVRGEDRAARKTAGAPCGLWQPFLRFLAGVF